MTPKETGPRLGRGLAALLGDPALRADEAGGGVRQTPVDLLEPNPFQPRRLLDDDALRELSDSIKARGVLQPLLIRPHPRSGGRFQIIAGERRWRAAQMAGLHEVPALVRQLSDMEAMAGALVENLQRQDLNPIEEADGYSRLLDEFGLTHETLAQAVGKSRSHLTNTLRLLHLPDVVKQAVRDGAISAGHARALLSLAAPEAALAAVITQGLSVRQTEALAERKHREQPKVQDPDLLALERELSEQLGMRVEIAPRGAGGAVRFHYQSLDQLDGLLSRIRGSVTVQSW